MDLSEPCRDLHQGWEVVHGFMIPCMTLDEVYKVLDGTE